MEVSSSSDLQPPPLLHHWSPVGTNTHYLSHTRLSLSMTFHFRDNLSSLSGVSVCVCVCANPHTVEKSTDSYICICTHSHTHFLIHIYTQTQIQVATYHNINSSFSLSEPRSPRPSYNNKSPSWIHLFASEESSTVRHNGLVPRCMAARTAINRNQQKHLSEFVFLTNVLKKKKKKKRQIIMNTCLQPRTAR